MKKNYAAKIVCMILALVMVAACFAACGETKENNGGTTADGTWYFGATGPLTGSAAQYGNSVKEGAQLAVDEINAAGGINGYKINFDIKDDEADPEKTGVRCFRKQNERTRQDRLQCSEVQQRQQQRLLHPGFGS